MMFSKLKKYTKDELEVGMRVNEAQLTKIYKTYIILSEVKLVEDETGSKKFEGTIESITNYRAPFKKDNSILIYHSRFVKDEPGYEYFLV